MAARDNITTITDGFRAPSVPRREGPDAGTAAWRGLQQIGDTSFRIGERLEIARQEQAVTEAFNAAHEKLETASLQAEQDTDWATLPERFRQTSQTIIAEGSASLRTGREKREFENQMTRLAMTARVRVQRQAFALQRDHGRAQLETSLAGLERAAAASGSPEELEQVDRLAEERIAGAVGAGLIDESAGGRLTRQFRSNTAARAVRQTIETDPQAALAALGDHDQLTDLDPDARITLESQARAEIKRQEAEAAAQARAARTELNGVLKDIADVSKAGLPVAPEIVQTARTLAVQSGDERAVEAVDQAIEILDFQRELAPLPPLVIEEQLNTMAQELSEAGASPVDAAKLTAGRQLLERTNRELDRDLLGHAVSVGMEVPALDFGAADVTDQLAARGVRARQIADYFGREPQYFTAQERALLGARLREGGARSRQQIAGAIVEGFGQSAPRALSEIGEEAPTAAHLGSLMTLGPQHERTVTDGFDGLEAIEGKRVEMPKDGELRPLFDVQIGAALDGKLGQVRENIYQAARAIYAARAMRGGFAEFNEPTFEQAVREAAGQYTTRAGNRGGLADVAGHTVLLPQGMTPGEFGRVLRDLEPVHLRTLSASGGAPMHFNPQTGELMPAGIADFADAWFVAVGFGVYKVSLTDPTAGLPQYLVDGASGAPYLIDFNDAGRLPRPRPPAPLDWKVSP